ncbi:MAG: phosphoribosylanthranilate isomerase [Candidatus Helarchaeota archaeon]
MEYIKICGLKEFDHIQICKKYGVNAVGFIYNVPTSPRNLRKTDLEQILNKISGSIQTVIVFKPSNVDELKNIMNDINTNYYQIHIKFNISELNILPKEMRKKIIVALRVNKNNIDNIVKIVNNNYNNFFAFLIDNSEGHGKKFNFNLINELKLKIKDVKLIVAGGIDIKNVENIIKKIKPFGIDVSSSLESKRGVKDPLKIANFLKKINEIRKN